MKFSLTNNENLQTTIIIFKKQEKKKGKGERERGKNIAGHIAEKRK